MTVVQGDLQLDLTGLILRIQQICGLPEESPLREMLIERLGNSDVPRLRGYLTEESLATLAEYEEE